MIQKTVCHFSLRLSAQVMNIILNVLGFDTPSQNVMKLQHTNAPKSQLGAVRCQQK